MRKFLFAIMSFLVMCSMVGCSSTSADEGHSQPALDSVCEEKIQTIKDGSTTSYPGVTFGDAFDSFFGDPTWEYQEADSNGTNGIITFSGYCTFEQEDIQATIEFTFSDDGTKFEATGLMIDEIPQGKAVLSKLLAAAFESFNPSDITQGSTTAMGEVPLENATDDSETEQVSEPESVKNQGKFMPVEYSSKFRGIEGFYLTEEKASDYFVKNMDSTSSFECMEEFIVFKYGPIIFDFYVDRYTTPDEWGMQCMAMDITLCMCDDYGWSDEEFSHIADDMRNVMYFSGDFSIYGNIEFFFYDGTSMVFSYDEMGVYLIEHY